MYAAQFGSGSLVEAEGRIAACPEISGHLALSCPASATVTSACPGTKSSGTWKSIWSRRKSRQQARCGDDAALDALHVPSSTAPAIAAGPT